MKPDNNLIRKFLKNQCSNTEAEFVRAYFMEHPEALEEYLPLGELLEERGNQLQPDVTDRMLQHIQESFFREKPKTKIKKLLWFAVAASLAGIIFFTTTQLFTKPGKRMPEQIVAIAKHADSIPIFKIIKNSTKQAMKTKLPDGSFVTIYPGGSLKCLQVFESNKRDVFLRGKALFNVDKDISRPFTVYASGIATTALGTSFIISERDDQKVSIRLIEGSVKVWQQNNEKKNKSVVLKPGDEMLVRSSQFSRYSINRSLGDDGGEKTKIITRATKEDTSVRILVFKDQSLKNVFRQIEKRFDVTINYAAAPGIEEKLFTGKFFENDDLIFVCNTICNLYDLQYKVEDTLVTISVR